MRIVVGLLGGGLVLLMLVEIFVAFLLPRRVKRDPAIVRTIFNYGWLPWRWVARRLPTQAADTMLAVRARARRASGAVDAAVARARVADRQLAHHRMALSGEAAPARFS
jgi:hypothetical protein